MDLNNQPLDKWLETAPDEAYHNKERVDLYSPYRVVEAFMNSDVHPHVVAMAALHDHPEGGYLTDHGPEHIRAVVSRASDLAAAPGLVLSPQEVFFLLLAIQIHDVGMLFAGRKDHELNARQILDEIEKRANIDRIQRRLIHQIAQSHGGTVNGSKDTIGALTEEQEGLRMQLLAAILRLADELSESRTRTSRYLLATGLISPRSEVYHRYAASLRDVRIAPAEKKVRLAFEIAEPYVSNRVQKGDGEVFLLDEIYERTLKMHLERTYCMRFMRPWVDINVIEVNIGVFHEGYEKRLRDEDIKYTLAERGYPTAEKGGIFTICDTLGSGRRKLTGERLRQSVQPKTHR